MGSRLSAEMDSEEGSENPSTGSADRPRPVSRGATHFFSRLSSFGQRSSKFGTLTVLPRMNSAGAAANERIMRRRRGRGEDGTMSEDERDHHGRNEISSPDAADNPVALAPVATGARSPNVLESQREMLRIGGLSFRQLVTDGIVAELETPRLQNLVPFPTKGRAMVTDVQTIKMWRMVRRNNVAAGAEDRGGGGGGGGKKGKKGEDRRGGLLGLQWTHWGAVLVSVWV